MGRATNKKSEQIVNLRNRVKLLMNMAEALDEKNADPQALTAFLEMIDNLETRIKRYREDWERHLTDER